MLSTTLDEAWKAFRAPRRLTPGQRKQWSDLTAMRVLTAHRRRLPDFLLVGAQRAGTTSVYSNLIAHPAILQCIRKEVHYFDNFFEHDPVWYRGHFPTEAALRRATSATGDNAITGEATPMYMFNPKAARRMAELLPDAKLIVMLRNPIERAKSQYKNIKQRLEWDQTFAEACRTDPILKFDSAADKMRDDEWQPWLGHYKPLLSRGLYVYQIERLLEMYDRDQMLIVVSEQIHDDQDGEYRRIFDFLGVSPVLPRKYQRSMPSKGKIDIELELREELREFFRPHNERLYEFLGEDLGWQ